MRKVQLLTFLMISFTGAVFASTYGKESLKRLKRIEIVALDTIRGYESVYANPDENLNDLFAEQIDSMFTSWFVQNSYSLNSVEAELDESKIISIPDSIYIKRLQSIESFVDLSYNNTVKNFIELYTQRKRGLTEFILGMSAYYFPMIEEQLDKYNLPMELKYLPIIESALNPNARSRANAVGLWQFMYGTGKMYKLEINTFLDERRDPVKSTEAAVKYLSDLYKIYKDWHLVIAAYNCGPGNVNKAIRRSGGTHDYWTIYYKLPRETRGYVPAFIAAAYVMNHYQAHSLNPRYPDFSIVTDTIKIHDYLHFNQIAEVLDIPVEELQALNPQYRMDIIPGKADKPYPLRIPMEHVGSFIDYEKRIFAHNRDKIFPNNEILVPKTQASSSFHPSEVQGKEKIYYTVKSGDNPGFISDWFHVRLNDLRYWNNINRNMIRVGQKLVIYVPKEYTNFYSEINNMTFNQKQEYAKTKPVANVVASTPASTPSASEQIEYDSEYIYYTVRSGDTLWSIAQQFPGVTNKDIIRLNNMTNANKIRPGQKLKIQAKRN
ncbi:MAG: transglycosylase SLT domain-containing protein [Mangrovibacterium sp.]